jgi:hypothetical protein
MSTYKLRKNGYLFCEVDTREQAKSAFDRAIANTYEYDGGTHTIEVEYKGRIVGSRTITAVNGNVERYAFGESVG